MLAYNPSRAVGMCYLPTACHPSSGCFACPVWGWGMISGPLNACAWAARCKHAAGIQFRLSRCWAPGGALAWAVACCRAQGPCGAAIHTARLPQAAAAGRPAWQGRAHEDHTLHAESPWTCLARGVRVKGCSSQWRCLGSIAACASLHGMQHCWPGWQRRRLQHRP